MLNLLSFIAGIIAVSHFYSLPDIHWWMLLSAVCALSWRPSRWFGCLSLGLLWGVFAGTQLLQQQIPASLENQELQLTGDVIDLPQPRERGQRFLFRVDSAQQYPSGESLNGSFSTQRVLLTWYDKDQIQVGDRLQLLVKLRRPRALVNDGGFDYQRWLLSRRIGATGYVRQSPHNLLLTAVHHYPVQSFRSRIQQWIKQTADERFGGPLLALAIGDKSSMRSAQWQLFRQTGTGHLMAISGLHIGLVAVFGFLIGRYLSTALALLGWQQRWQTVLIPALFSCTFATFYAALAGFALPTQRALVMVLMLNGAVLLNRGHHALRALALAAVVVLLLDPLAGWDMGFWLSFGAVATLVAFFQYRHHTKPLALYGKFKGFLRAQGVVFVGLLVPLLAFNTPLSLFAPLANLIVIPAVSVLVVIPLLISILMQSVGLPFADVMLQFAGYTLQGSLGFLDLLPATGALATFTPSGPQAHSALMIVAIIGVGVLLLGRGMPGRWLGLLLLLPVLLPGQRTAPPLSVTILDVGQGLAVVARTPEQTLLYDTGARFSERFDAGEAVVLAFLRAEGIKSIDTLVVSHGDNDHAGGLEAVLAGVEVSRIVSGEELFSGEADAQKIKLESCEQTENWQWQAVNFQLIEPMIDVSHSDNNNLSCVLLISFGEQHILLPGDIESRVERALVRHQQLPEKVQTIVAPHHGSRTSSTATFLNYTQPDTVIYSAAYNSRYGHPHPHVTERYQNHGAIGYNTATSGQIRLVWSEQGEVTVSELRQSRRRYWYGSD